MANIESKQVWVKTGRTFAAPLHLCDEIRMISKHEREIIAQTWEMEKEGWEPGTWATLVRERLRKPRKS